MNLRRIHEALSPRQRGEPPPMRPAGPDDWTDDQLDDLFEKGGTDEVAARIADPSVTGVHHVGWESHARRGTRPYENSDTTGKGGW